MASSKSWILVTCLVVTAVVDARTFFQNGRFGKRIIDTNQPLASLLTGPISSLLLHDKFDKDDSFRLYDKRPERFFFGNRYGKRNSFKPGVVPDEYEDAYQLLDCSPTLVRKTHRCRRQEK